FQRNNNKGGNKVGVENINNPVQFASLANIKIALANDGFADISIQYLGEYWILIKFSSQDARQSFCDSVSVGSWFSILKEASSDFHCDKRIAWVETEGISFKLWTENTFKRIASRWGVFLSVDDQEELQKIVCPHHEYKNQSILKYPNEPDAHELFISKLIQQKLQNEYAQTFLTIAITSDLPTVELEDSLTMWDEHLDTIPATESDEFIKSSVENLVRSPSESEDLSDRIDESDYDPEEEIRLNEKLLYDNSSPRPPEEFISENSHAAIKSFFPSPIPVEDSNSLIEEIDLSFTPDDPMSLGIEEDDYDSERDILICEELLSNDSLLLPKNDSFHFDIPSFPRPPAKPPDDNSGIFTVKVVNDISKHDVPMPRLLPTQPTLISNQEESPHLLSHRDFKASQLHSECPMMIYGGNTPILDVPFLHFYPLDQAKYGEIGSS
nr:glucose-methanol-choline oxidoreductase, FAD/NAD(P)-binding domain protein [Tanacetum cinerariifolium]